MEDLLKEINYLAKKSKEEGLNESEKKRQKELRQKYLKIFRSNFKQQLDNVKIVDEK